MPQIIAFGHRSRVGKDTSAKLLDSELRIRKIRVKKVSFAAKLKDVCHQLYGWDGLKPGIFYEDEEGAKFRDVKLPTIGKTPVEIWIEVGNLMRTVYLGTWIDHALKGTGDCDVIIVTDLRYPNEAEAIQKLGGWCVKITRPDQPYRDSVADNALEDWTGWDEIIVNNSDISMLNSAMELIAYSIQEKLSPRVK